METGMRWPLDSVLAEVTNDLGSRRQQLGVKMSGPADTPTLKKPAGDRFIPIRSKYEECGRLDVADQKENHAANAQDRKQANIGKQCKARRRLLQFNGDKKAVAKEEDYIQDMALKGLIRINRSAKKVTKATRKAEKVLDAPGLVNDYYLNLIDWGKNNLLAVCLGEGAFVWNPATQDGHQFYTSDNSLMIPTAVAWSPYVIPILPRTKD